MVLLKLGRALCETYYRCVRGRAYDTHQSVRDTNGDEERGKECKPVKDCQKNVG
jgi:hypothetical protein